MKKIILTFIFLTLLFVNLGALSGLTSRQDPKDNSLNISTAGQGSYNLVYKSAGRGPLTIMVFDITGKYVYLKNIKDFGGELKENIDLGAQPKGIYVFEVESNDSRETKKIIYQ